VKLWDKIKAKFHKHNDCGCESSCNSCGGATAAPAEVIPGKPAPGTGSPMPAAPKGSVMNGGMIVTPVVAPRLTNEQPF
jgi:hypothetical protein